jgi:RNA polymerase sigma factor (sigma-70 family)
VTDSDALLVARARAGDDDAFGALVRRHERAARAVARSLVGDADEAEDLAQQAFVRAHRNLDLLADPARFGAWLSRIVFGVSVDWLRAFKTDLWHTPAELPDLPAPGTDGLERLEREELAARVLAAVHALPERYRVPLSLFHLEGLSQARVAETLGVPAGTVRSLVTRARQRLHALLAPDLDMPDTAPGDVFDERATPRLLHILNGDCTRELLERTDVPGTFAVWAHALHDGPVPSFDLGDAEWRAVRDRWADRAGWGSEQEADDMAARWDRAVARYPEFDEAVIWLEHDLFDQLLLIRHLAWFAERPMGDTRLALICVGEWPGMPEFKGLGELAPAELASLLGTRQRVTQRQLELGRRAWRAFTAPDPRALDRLVAEEDTSALEFLAPALRRFLEDYPWVDDGLSRTDRQLLRTIAAGVTDVGALWRAQHRLESHYFITDLTLIGRLRELAGAPHPLIVLDEGGERWWERGRVALADAGRAVLDGGADAVALNGIDRWYGGVRLEGTAPAWRWHGERGRIVPGAPA